MGSDFSKKHLPLFFLSLILIEEVKEKKTGNVVNSKEKPMSVNWDF